MEAMGAISVSYSVSPKRLQRCYYCCCCANDDTRLSSVKPCAGDKEEISMMMLILTLNQIIGCFHVVGMANRMSNRHTRKI